MSTDAFFEPVSPGVFRATAHTEGPWGPGLTHGGPAAALLGRAMESAVGNPEWTPARISVDILGPIPVAELAVRAEVLRPGRSVELTGAELSAGDRVVARARGWWIRTTDGVEPTPSSPPPPRPSTEDLCDWPGGYVSAVEWRFAQGRFDQPGSATVWTRARVPLVVGEPLSALQRVLLVADSGNGVSSERPLSDFWFINPELTVHLIRLPETEWICLEAETSVSAGGVGLAESRLYDAAGPIGRGAQSLLVGPRSAG